MPHQRENGPSAPVQGRPALRPHHHSHSSPMSHISGSQDYTKHHLTPANRKTAYGGSNPVPSVTGSRYAGARAAPSAVVYHNSGGAN